MADEERWTAAHAMTNFDDLLERVVTTCKPVFIVGERNSAVLISMEDWDSIQEKLRPRSPPDL
ncbi:type II toxin-antitoxin system Phd/YefM family antitoxin [Pseudomonas sp.]|uniref:type II toxin-antitoxin system Phd/YefM family antitoxin n=1 Tax=Pseudomonas sp. TaxID=306 RepID=UPI003D6F5F16